MAEKIKLEIEVDASQGEKAMGDLGKATNDTKQGVGELSGGLDSMTGGAVSGITRVLGSVKKVITSFGVLRGAIAGVGIGALLIGFKSLTMFFSRTERGAQELRATMAGLEAAADQLADRFSALGEAIFNSFQKGNEGGKNQLTTMQKLTITTAAFLEHATFLGSIFGGITADVAKATVNAVAYEKALNVVKVAQREINVERAEALKLIAEARLAAEDESKSVEDRKNAIMSAAELEADITKRELANEMERLRIMEAQAALSESDEETLDAIAQQKQRVSQIELASFNLNRRLKLELNTLDNEIRAEQERKDKAARDAKAARLAAEKEEAKIFLEETKALRQLQADEEISFITEQEKRKLAVRTDFGEAYNLQEEEFMQKRAKMTKADGLNTLNQAAGILTGLAALNAGAEAKTEDQKKKQFKRGQALAVASTLIQTFQAALAAFNSAVAIPIIGPVAGPIAAAAATGFGLAQVAQIKRQKYSGGGGGGGAGSAPSISFPREPIQTNAARGIDIDTDNEGANSGTITKTYVLSKDVSSKQELDAAIKRESVI